MLSEAEIKEFVEDSKKFMEMMGELMDEISRKSSQAQE